MRLFEWGVAIKKGVFNFDCLRFVVKMIFSLDLL